MAVTPRYKFLIFCILFVSLFMFAPASTFSKSFQGKIVNGTQAGQGEFPFAVSLRHGNRHVCGATLLNRAWILTAAHCVHNANAINFDIQYGSVELLNPLNKTQMAIANLVNISKIFVHPGYDIENQYIHDIALLKLINPIALNVNFASARLPEMLQPTPSDLPVVVIGWGLNATGGSVQRYLQKVQLQTFSDEECQIRHQTALHPDTTLCAGVPEGGKGQCSGDSGGPLLIKDTNEIVGIVSWSRKPCTIAPFPGIFTEVAAYVDWILDTVGDESNDDDNIDDESIEELMSGNLIIVRKHDPFGDHEQMRRRKQQAQRINQLQD